MERPVCDATSPCMFFGFAPPFYNLHACNDVHASRTSANCHFQRAPNIDANNRENCFVAESAHIFAEPGRDIVVGVGAHIGADVFLHGPVTVRVSGWLGCFFIRVT